jgi:MFS family permease
MNIADTLDTARRGRWAVAAMFFANGFIIGSWAPQIPVLLTRLDIRETTLGFLILVFGIGALCAMPWAGFLMSRHGSQKVLRAFAVLSSVGLLSVALAGNLWFAAPAMFFLGRCHWRDGRRDELQRGGGGKAARQGRSCRRRTASGAWAVLPAARLAG